MVSTGKTSSWLKKLNTFHKINFQSVCLLLHRYKNFRQICPIQLSNASTGASVDHPRVEFATTKTSPVHLALIPWEDHLSNSSWRELPFRLMCFHLSTYPLPYRLQYPPSLFCIFITADPTENQFVRLKIPFVFSAALIFFTTLENFEQFKYFF